MSYTTTTLLGLKKAVVGSNQAFETSVFNDNWNAIDAGLTSTNGDVASIDTRVTALETTPTPVTVSGTTYSLLTSDIGKTVVFTSGSAVAVTVPNILVAGERIDLIQDGAGKVTFTAGSGVTLHSVGGNFSIYAQYAGATIICVASGQYRLIGNLIA